MKSRAEQLDEMSKAILAATDRIRYYKQQDKMLQSKIKRLKRNERTHRLCTRGGMIEAFIQEPEKLSDDQVILTKSTKSRLEELEAARDELENKIALEKLAKPRISEEFVRFFLERFRDLDLSKLEHRKMLIEVFLNAVYVFNDKIVISCNYKDGTKTVNFSEMESALTLRASASGSDLDCPGAPQPLILVESGAVLSSLFFFGQFAQDSPDQRA